MRLPWLAHDEAPGPYITYPHYRFDKTKQHTLCGDAESVTKFHLGRVGVDVLGKISGREIDGQDEMKMRCVIE